MIPVTRTLKNYLMSQGFTEEPVTESGDDSEQDIEPTPDRSQESADIREIYSVALTLRESVINEKAKWYD